MMLSNHYPLAFASEMNWLIAALVFLMGVTIRHYFNSRHAGTGNPTWTWLVTVLIMIVIAWLSNAPRFHDGAGDEKAMLPGAVKFAQAEGFEDVHDIVMGRCSMCHAAEPFYEGVHWAPKGLVLDNASDIAAHAAAIYLFAGRTDAMPPANVSFMEPDERAKIVAWYRAAIN